MRLFHAISNRGKCWRNFPQQKLVSEIGIPMSVFFDHGVDDDEQLSHTGGYDYFEQFAFGFEAIGELADDGVAAPGGQGSATSASAAPERQSRGRAASPRGKSCPTPARAVPLAPIPVNEFS